MTARQTLRRSLILVIPLLFLAASASAQTIAQIKARGRVNIGVMVDVPPFALLNDEQQPDGYDADVAKSLAKRMGVTPNLVVVTGPNRIPYLLTGKVDMLVAVLGIIPERTKLVAFSEPYAGFSQFIYGRVGKKMKSVADLAGLTVGVPRANTTDITLSRVAPDSTTILRFDDDASVRQALLAGQVDAVTASVTSVPALDKLLGPGQFERKFDLQTQVQGVAVRPASTELLAWINAQIEDMKKSGELAAINQKWVGYPLPDLSMPAQ